MNWVALLPIIAQYGIAVGEKLFQLFTANLPPTQADWDELNRLASQTAKSKMIDALNKAGIPLTDPKAVALLALV